MAKVVRPLTGLKRLQYPVGVMCSNVWRTGQASREDGMAANDYCACASRPRCGHAVEKRARIGQEDSIVKTVQSILFIWILEFWISSVF